MIVQLVLLGCCLHASWTDLRFRKIPNRTVLFGFVTISLLHLATGGVSHLLAQLLFAALPLLVFGLASLIWPAGIGMGDVKLLALVCFALGLRPFAMVLTLASLSALFFACGMLLRKRASRGSSLPFAPFLTLGLLAFLLLDTGIV